MEQHTIGTPYSDSVVQVYQVANRVWIADGEALGDQLRVRGSTAGKALIAWRKAAVKRVSDGLSSPHRMMSAIGPKRTLLFTVSCRGLAGLCFGFRSALR